MILQALTEYYRTLEQAGKISAPGWKKSDISYAIYISDSGALEQIVPIKVPVQQGKKTVLRPQSIELPVPTDGRTSTAIRPNFLWDKSDYLLGISKGGTERGAACFAGAAAHHKAILSGISSPASAALLSFFQTWEPEKAMEYPPRLEYIEDFLKGATLLFRYGGGYVHEDAAVRDAWQRYYSAQESGIVSACLVTGKTGSIARIHPKIKGIINGEAMGNTLVGFNSPAVCSYGKEQSYNAPVSQEAVFFYTTALNHLLSDREHVYRMGDATVVCWAKCGGDVYQNLMGWALFGQEPSYTLTDLQGALKNLCDGSPVELDEERLDPNMEFYILGLSPNAARLSVRFFLHNTFGHFLKNAQAHQQRLEIVKPAYDKFDVLPLWKLLDETVNQNSRDKTPAPNMAGEVLRSILTDTRYPATLLSGVTLRIRAEHAVTRGRAAIIKAYYLKNPHSDSDVPKEVLTVSLNPDSSNLPYNLGRLFSVLEAIQSAANPGINSTIKDKYFNSASATPAIVFPVLLNLAQKHLKKLDTGLRTYHDKQLTALLSKLGEGYPQRLNLPQQGSFQLGYYHQTQVRFEKKEEK